MAAYRPWLAVMEEAAADPMVTTWELTVDDAAGKTTILYKLKLGEVVTTIPTIALSMKSKTR